MNEGVLFISFSALFADLGYQTVQALFPIYLVLSLYSSPLYFGIANAFAYGGGALFAYSSGLLSSRYSRKWLAVLGSVFIVLLSMIGLTINPLVAIALFAAGWWARNFRVPPRRAMLTDYSSREDRGKAFGFLHALDIGGGMLSVVALILLLGVGLRQNTIFLLTAIPLFMSVLMLLLTTDIRRKDTSLKAQGARKAAMSSSTYKGILLATALYGFSYYSLGFPILTIAKSSGPLLGIGSYGVYLGVSAATGYYIGSRKGLNRIKALGYLGYMLSGIGTGLLAVGYASGGALWVYYLGIAMMGFGLGVIETLEPTIVSLIRSAAGLDSAMGSLQGSRGLGLFFANLVMGLLYVISPSYSYIYAAAVSIAAGAIVLAAGRGLKP